MGQVQEVATLARCQSDNITQYYASVLKPGTSELLIVMELMAASVADLVSTCVLPHEQQACKSKSHKECSARVWESTRTGKYRVLPVQTGGAECCKSLCHAAIPGSTCFMHSWTLEPCCRERLPDSCF